MNEKLMDHFRAMLEDAEVENAKLREQLAAMAAALAVLNTEMETVVYSGFDPDRWGERMGAISAAGKVLKEWNTPKPC